MKKIISLIIIFSFFIPQTIAHYSRFYFGQCTRYVGKMKDVPWWGNAKDWVKNAKKMWYNTWKKPKEGAIIVWHGPWYSLEYGHVWIVEKVLDKENIIVSDMNYKWFNIISYRIEKIKNKSILGYIYY